MIKDNASDLQSTGHACRYFKNNEQLYMTGREKANGRFPEDLYIPKMNNPDTRNRSHVPISTPEYNCEKEETANHKGPKILNPSDGHVLLIYFGRGLYSVGRFPIMPGGDPLNRGIRTSAARRVLKESAVAGADGTRPRYAKSTPDFRTPVKTHQKIEALPWNFNGIHLKIE